MEAYYINQAKGGITNEPSGFNRRKYNTNRFLGRGFFTNSVKPLVEKALPFVGRTLVNTAQCFVNEVKKESGLFDVKGGGCVQEVDMGSRVYGGSGAHRQSRPRRITKTRKLTRKRPRVLKRKPKRQVKRKNRYLF